MREEELDRKQGLLSKWSRKFFGSKQEEFKMPIEPRSLDQILNLKDIDLKVKKGEFVIIVGEVASGKSSLLNTIFGEMTFVS